MANFEASPKQTAQELKNRASNIESTRLSRNFDQADEVRPFEGHGHLDVVQFDDGFIIGRGVFEPGWKWSNDVKPLAGTASCEAAHSGYCTEGTMVVRLSSGNEFRINAGDAFHIPPGHDAWVEGNQRCVLIDVGGYANYAKPTTH